MSDQMYQCSVPVMIRMLGNLKKILNKAERHAGKKKIDPTVLLNGRLAPDMFPLIRQVQIASDTAKGCAARLAGRKVPAYKDNEKSFAQLYQRIDKTVAFLKKVRKADLEGAIDREVVLQFPSVTMNFKGLDYLNNFALPNFYFHVTTAYAILRHNGIGLGKRDFLG